MFEIKDFELLYRTKLNHSEMLNVHNNYFFCINDYIIFIKKSKKFYKVMASSCCGFEPTFREGVFDCLYYNEDLNNSVDMFRSYIGRLICRV